MRFEVDRSGFGVVRFPREAVPERHAPDPLHTALENTLNIRVEMRRKRLFGPRIASFLFMGERVTLNLLKSGDTQIDLSRVDDDVREMLIEQLRLSQDFDI